MKGCKLCKLCKHFVYTLISDFYIRFVLQSLQRVCNNRTKSHFFALFSPWKIRFYKYQIQLTAKS